MIPRDEYLDNLISFKDKRLIKVVTGVRRCGKSTLFELYQDYLLAHGVEAGQIISVNLEAGEFADIADDRALYDYVNARLDGGRMNYIFLDEVQRVEGFQKAVDALYIKKNCDVYITGSNAYLLSGSSRRCSRDAMSRLRCCRFPSRSMPRHAERTSRRSVCTRTIFTTAPSHTRLS